MRVLAILMGIGLLSAPAWGAVCNESFTVVLSESNSTISSKRVEVIEDEVAWCDAWADIYGNMFPMPGCDTTLVDFNSEVAVLVGLGWRSNGCYSVDVSCIHRTANDYLGVLVTETVPGPNCGCAAVITNPVTVVKVARPVNDIRFRRFEAELSCP